MENIRAYYDQFASSYQLRRSDGLALNPLPYLKFFLSHLPGLHMADLGCGPGFESELAVERGLKVTGIDISERMLQLFREKNPAAEIIQADLSEIPCLSHSFDLVLASFSLLHCTDIELAERLREIARVAKPRAEGLFLVGTLDTRLEVEQIHREAKDIPEIKPIPFCFRSIEEWHSALEKACWQVIETDYGTVPGSPLRTAAIYVRKGWGRSGQGPVNLHTSWRDNPLEETARLGESLKAFSGISRLSRLDSLTDFSIPIYQGSRPNSKIEVTVCGGKGITAEESRTSALFEGLEYTCAEELLPSVRGSIQELAKLGPIADLGALGIPAVKMDQELEWTPMREFMTNREFFVPSCLVGLTNSRLPLRPNTHGLASGTTFGEALLHAFLELIERHNFSHALVYKKAVTVDTRAAADADIASLHQQAERANLKFEIKDTSWPTGIPSHFALLYNLDERDSHLIGGGLGCHIDPSISVRRAMLEALQSRAVSVAGGREDLERQARAQGERFQSVLDTYSFWYEPTAAAVTLGAPILERSGKTLHELVESLYWQAREADDLLGRLFYYSIPSPNGTHVVRCVFEGAEVFGLFPDRPGPRIRRLLEENRLV